MTEWELFKSDLTLPKINKFQRGIFKIAFVFKIANEKQIQVLLYHYNENWKIGKVSNISFKTNYTFIATASNEVFCCILKEQHYILELQNV